MTGPEPNQCVESAAPVYRRCPLCRGFATKLQVADVKKVRMLILRDLEDHLRSHTDR